MNERIPTGWWRCAAVSGFLAVVLVLSGCATKDANGPGEPEGNARIAGTVLCEVPSSAAGEVFEDYGEDEEIAISDPWQPWNRMWFRFNDVFLLNVMKPLHQGYSAVVPQPFRNGLSNALHNIQAPVRILNRLLQGEIKQMWVEIGRFILNSTFGGAGLLDIAGQYKVLVPFSEDGADFGGTLAVWGVGEGIYLVWPFIGPSTARDTVGFAGDWAASPFFWGTEPVGPVDTWAGYTASGTLRFNDLGRIINAYETLVNHSVEPYAAVRDAYVKSRRSSQVPPEGKTVD